MLRRLTIQNYALIESLDINFPDGLIIITGETGAGKSILLGAVSLLLGGKADSNVFGSSQKNCVVEGEFVLGGKEYILRRVISPAGRSRSFINDEPASNAELSEISSRLIDIHAQHKQLLLNDKNFQLKVLDYFSGTGELLAKYKVLYDKILEQQTELARMDAQIAADRKDKEYREFQFKKLKDADLSDGELEELEAEQKRLANAEEIKSSILEVSELLNGESVSLVQNIKESEQLLEKCSKFVPGFEELAKRLESCRIECQDIVEEIERQQEKISVSPDRLAEVEERTGVLYSLLKRFDSPDVAGLIKERDKFADELAKAEKGCGEREKLSAELEKNIREREKLAGEISKRRNGSAGDLSRLLEREIKELEMPKAHFRVEVEELKECGPSGKNETKFMFTANGADKLIEIQKVASGGELSRIMLCIKKLMAEYTGMPAMIFDEIDVGVSGSIADKMGKMLDDMGKRMQIFAITHLPQVASKGETHLLVYKEFDTSQHAHTNIKFIKGKERLMEIARLLSGEKMSDAAVENAKVLLGVKR